MGGMALNFLAFCYYVIEIKNIRWWTQPFLVFGMNAIASFFLSSLVAKTMGIIKVSTETGESISLKAYIFKNFFLPFLEPINASLAYAICYVLFWYLIMLILYKKKSLSKFK